ncbi:non-canonical purine NTP pyrophosphatase, partial [Veillonella infantium]|uniref:non-canonical purine NTP pyrophosphatase n=1 Tax=Veillonella infantium TaxID=1911679 RepID=UPI0034E955DB
MHLFKPLKENNNMERIVLATGNKGKIREFERAFSHMNITCVPVKDIVDVPEPQET